jgi:hypothetical protein
MKNEEKGVEKVINEHTGIAVRVLVMTAILAILCLFSVLSVSALHVTENVKFKTTGANTTFIMGSTFSFDTIEVHSTYLRLGNATISVCPSAGSIAFTLFNLSGEYRKWNESCSILDATTNHTMGGLKTNTPYLVKANGAIYGCYASNESGYVFFTYSGGYSDIVFEMEKGICGDVNGNEVVDMSDVIDLLYYVGYPGQYTICNEWAADVNCDETMDMSDVRDLLYYVGYPGQYELNRCCGMSG